MSDPVGPIGAAAQRITRTGDDIRGQRIDFLGPNRSEGPSFGDTLEHALGEVSATQDAAQDYMARYVRGEPVELHQVMAATEEAGIGLEMLVELRNKLTEAYRTVVNMQS